MDTIGAQIPQGSKDSKTILSRVFWATLSFRDKYAYSFGEFLIIVTLDPKPLTLDPKP